MTGFVLPALLVAFVRAARYLCRRHIAVLLGRLKLTAAVVGAVTVLRNIGFMLLSRVRMRGFAASVGGFGSVLVVLVEHHAAVMLFCVTPFIRSDAALVGLTALGCLVGFFCWHEFILDAVGRMPAAWSAGR